MLIAQVEIKVLDGQIIHKSRYVVSNELKVEYGGEPW